MAVVFDAVGPSSSGAVSTGDTSLSWTHTCGAGGVALWVAVALGGTGGFTIPITLTLALDPSGANTPIPSLGSRVRSGTSSSGYVQLFGLPDVSAGAHEIAVTSSANASLEGGSLSYRGADLTAPFGVQQSASSAGAAASLTLSHTGSTSGNMVAAGVVSGTSLSSPSAGTSRFVANQNNSNGGGNGAGADNPGGGTTVFTWAPTSSDHLGIAGVEILGDTFTGIRGSGYGRASDAAVGSAGPSGSGSIIGSVA